MIASLVRRPQALSRLSTAFAGVLALAACSGSASEAPTATPMASATLPAASPTAALLLPTQTPLAVTSRRFALSDWKTDFSKALVPLTEIQSGGPPRDGIPPIDQPKFVSPTEAGAWLKDQEPVIAIELGADARAYPLQILIWHEIVNDLVGDVPVAITFCPLCNTAIAFDRRVDGSALRFGTTGNLRHSDLVMWSDDPGETWWQQITGQGLVGDLVGRQLATLPAEIVAFSDFKAAFPSGRVLSRNTGHPRNYGSNPYVGYDDINSSPFLYSGPTDGRLRPMERVVTVELGGETAAYPFSQLARAHVVNDTVGGTSIVVLHQPGAVSALDASVVSASRDVGAAAAFEATVASQRLTFTATPEGFHDDQTGSTWDILGRATDGTLAGQHLKPVVSANHFWFAWVVFKPDTRVWAP